MPEVRSDAAPDGQSEWPQWRYALAASVPLLLLGACLAPVLLWSGDHGKAESSQVYERLRGIRTFDELPTALASYENTRFGCQQLTGNQANPCSRVEVISEDKTWFFLEPFYVIDVVVGPDGRILSVSEPEYVNPD